MERFPTFIKAVRAVSRLALSGRLWRSFGLASVTLLVVAALGSLSSLLSESSSRRQTRELIVANLGSEPSLPWLDERELERVPLEEDEVKSYPFPDRHPGIQSLFAATHRYSVSHVPGPVDVERPAYSWGYVRCETGLPFVVRAYYGFGASIPRRNLFQFPSRSGRYGEGVATYVACFGMAVRVYDWSMGGIFD